VELEPDALVELPPSTDLLALDEALQRLTAMDASHGRLVELRFFAGLSIVEAADVLGISRATADRNWAFARAWLFKELRSDGTAEPGATGEDESGVTA